jgi:hypothetical protein
MRTGIGSMFAGVFLHQSVWKIASVFLRAVAKLRKAAVIGVVMSVCQYGKTRLSLGRIFMNFVSEIFF